MADECTCHLGHPPCSYCTDGTDGFQEALGFAQGLDDNELDRLRRAIDDLIEERAKESVAKGKVLAILLKEAQTANPRHLVALGIRPNPDLTPRERVAQIGLMVKTIGLREKVRKAMVKAMAIPSDPKPWAAFDAADRSYYEPTALGPRGDGAQWDNRRGRGR